MNPVHRSMLKSFVLMALCLISLNFQIAYRVPSGPLALVLPWVGFVLAVFNLILFVDAFLTGPLTSDSVRRALHRMERWSFVFIGIFVSHSLLLCANGALDRSLPVDHPSDVLKIVGEEIRFGSGVLPLSWIELRSWKDARRTERLPLPQGEQRAFWSEQPVVVQIRQGYFNMPWVFKLERDEERYAREILKAIPTAARPQQNLVEFYLRHERWDEAGRIANAYLTQYPHDYTYARYWSAMFENANHDAQAIALLEPFLTQQPTFDLSVMMGRAYSKVGNWYRAIECLEAAIVLQPDNFLGYYHLGYVYRALGEIAHAVAMFEEVLKRQPNFPEIEEQLSALRRSAQSGVHPAQRDSSNTFRNAL